MTGNSRAHLIAMIGVLMLLCIGITSFSPQREDDGTPVISIPPDSSHRIGVIGLKPGLDAKLLRGRIVSPHPRIQQDLELLGAEGFVMRPLFSRPPLELREERAAAVLSGSDVESPDLGRWFLFELPAGTTMKSALERLLSLPFVETAYALPKAHPASSGADSVPNFTSMQSYLGPAPGGLDAEHLWTLPGGKGRGVRIADVEGDWNYQHNDLARAKERHVDGHLLGGIWLQHGTAVLGELVGTRNSFGITGIAHRARLKMFSIGRWSSEKGVYTNVPDAINRAAAALRPGDVILIEVQYSGLRSDEAYIPVEYYDADFEAIRSAVAKGIIVIEAGGNGGQDLDKSLYSDRFNRKVRGDSGAIMVGAGVPPGSSRPDRSRLFFSNYGSRLDVQGWGSAVTTTGYGDLYRQGGKNDYYTDSFNGTSSASGMLGGAVTALQGYAKKALGKPLTPKQLRKILIKTGSPQQGNINNKIGPRPNLRKASKKILKMSKISGG